MKSNTNWFAHLGLDAQNMRGVPDELVFQLVKAAFRALIKYYHDDTRTFSNDIAGGNQKKNFDRRRREMYQAYEILSTPAGRLETLAKFRSSSTADLRTELEELGVAYNELSRSRQIEVLDLLLDRVGALRPRMEGYPNPAHAYSGTKILCAYDFGEVYGNMFELSIGKDGIVKELVLCKHIPEQKTIHRLKQKWKFESEKGRRKSYAVPIRKIPFEGKFTLMGTVPHTTIVELVQNRKVAGLIESSVKKKKIPIEGLPFYRLAASELLPIIRYLTPFMWMRNMVVLVDVKGTFFFPGLLQKTQLPEKFSPA